MSVGRAFIVQTFRRGMPKTVYFSVHGTAPNDAGSGELPVPRQTGEYSLNDTGIIRNTSAHEWEDLERVGGVGMWDSPVGGMFMFGQSAPADLSDGGTVELKPGAFVVSL